MLVKGNFAQLDALADQIVGTVNRVQSEMDGWATTAGATSEDWLDGAGEQFAEVNAAWKQVSEAQQTMLTALRTGVQQANQELQQALAAAVARVGSTGI
jgi:uncharacterized protein YukE